tara:strand:+ start:39967 stop:41085 length:1119 start_codon:yes stop_codon:yes gene_type:complete
MKILVVFTYNYSLLTWKDSGTLNKELKTYKLLIEKNNIDYTFLTFDDPKKVKDIFSNTDISVISVFEKIKKSKYKKINYFKSFLIPFYFKNELKDIDIIKQNQLMGSWISLMLKFLLKKPLIIRTGYDMYEFSKKENKKKLIQVLYKYLTYFSLLFSDLYLVSSKCDFNFLKKEFKFNISKLLIRPNWVTKTEYVELKNRIENRIVCIGRLVNQKNFSFIISAFSHSNYVIDIIGDGELKKDLQILAKNSNTKINFLGNLENEEILNILPTYKFYITSSIYEGNPKSTLEAMSAGCIVVASNIDNHAEIINNEKNGFLFSFEEKEFISFFKKINNRKDLDEISIAARESVLYKNSLEKLSNLEYEDYLKLIV